MAVWVPRSGALVELRGAQYRVLDVEASPDDPQRPAQHWVTAESLERKSQRISVLWEHEVDARVLDEAGLAGFGKQRGNQEPLLWSRFRAFLLAQRWSTAGEEDIQAPLRAGLTPAGYQLVPLTRALERPRVNLLIADDVGLGKTIEAGLILQELMARKRIRRVLLVCPASIKSQWKSELQEHFNLNFDLVDRRFIEKLRKRHRSSVNPWQTSAMAIVSMDFLKREEILEDFLDAARHGPGWDLLLVDEAHHLAASDSERSRMARKLTPQFEHRLFLTATPHHGKVKQFQALLGLLDPERFPPGQRPKPHSIRQVMLRRRKSEIELPEDLKAPKRSVAFLPWKPTEAEKRLHHALDLYLEALQNDNRGHQAAALIACLLKKRALSSIQALRNSLEAHRAFLQRNHPDTPKDDQFLLDKSWFDDEVKHRDEIQAIARSSSALKYKLSPDSIDRLDKLERALEQCRKSGKVAALLSWLQKKEHRGHKVVIFTEFRDTLNILAQALAHIPCAQIRGGMAAAQRQAALDDFNNPEGARILLATDAACEGLNLQHCCSRLVHFETPWDPCRMEQRNGRIDRLGQSQEDVQCLHFLGKDRRDEQLLKVLVNKIARVRRDIGPVGRIVARRVEHALLANRDLNTILDRPDDRRRHQQLTYRRQARRLIKKLEKTKRRLQCRPRDLRFVIDQALELEGAKNLIRKQRAWVLEEVPRNWRSAAGTEKDISTECRWTECKGHKHARPLHLNAPIVKRAIESLRALKQARCAVPCPGKTPQVIVFTRITWRNRDGAAIREDDRILRALIENRSLRWQRSRETPPWACLERQNRPTLPLPEQERDCQQQIVNRLERLRRREKSRAKRTLSRVRQRRLRDQRRLIDRRLKEVDSLLAIHDQDRQQGALWPPARWLLPGTEAWELERCRENLIEERRKAPKILKSRFQLDPSEGIHIEIYAILYGIPAHLRTRRRE